MWFQAIVYSCVQYGLAEPKPGRFEPTKAKSSLAAALIQPIEPNRVFVADLFIDSPKILISFGDLEWVEKE
jgi:hypothetical protein